MYRMANRLKSRSVERDLWDLAGRKLNMSHSVPWLMVFLAALDKVRVAGQEVTLPIYPVLVRLQLECWVQFWVPSTKETCTYWRGPRECQQDAEGAEAPLL